MLNWLAPATVCMLVTLAAFRQENRFPIQPARNDRAVVTMLTNASTVAYLTAEPSQMVHNLLLSTFEFTNLNGSMLNEGFTSFTKPNQ
jgi:hypothetical protein